MSTFTLNMKYEADASLPITVEELLPVYMVGIPLKGLTGDSLTYAQIENYIRDYTKQLETMLSLKIPLQMATERADFSRKDFNEWGYLRSTYFIMEVESLVGKLGGEITYPNDWLSYETNGDGYMRNIFIVPGQSALSSNFTQSNAIVFSGAHPIFYLSRTSNVPFYWQLTYLTGFKKVPRDILVVLGKLVTIQLLNVLGDITFGAGIASKSLSIDGLSQSIGTTQSAENSLYSARIRQYGREMKDIDLPAIKAEYRSIVFDVA